ncbi:S9 family peptidase [Novosphingobium sp. KCTC 2891]|uniref:S9 family peptidase n=1 Tax=Novosphingobium sp. KCTC 2891 TaxID=2989730 RepID=UPI002221BFE5|nr:S9 family peptidase [Novosphingobium sp. KCTC 2891]MCW1381789.1 S9 family peptidase [Novosphingobium sp. KCTC 2891]
MKLYARRFAGLLLAGLSHPVLAQQPVGDQGDGAALAARFGALESVRQISISPDGQKVVYIASRAQGGALVMVADLAAGGQPKAILAQKAGTEQLQRCVWATDTRIVCSNYTVVDYGGFLFPMSRLFAMNGDGSNVQRLSAGVGSNTLGTVALTGGVVIDWDLPGKPGSVLMTRYYVPDTAAQANVKREIEGFGVEAVDTATGQRHNVERPLSEAVEYISDGQGNVRIMGVQSRDPDGDRRNKIKYSFRLAGSRQWQPLSTVRVGSTGLPIGFDPYAVDSAQNVVYGFEDLNGYKALYSIALDGTDTQKLVLSRPGVDVDSLVRIGRDRRVVGVSYASDIRSYEFFDPELKKLGTGLGKALPGQPSVTFLGASAGEDKLLLLASSDVDPGMFYRFDKATRQLAPLLPVRGELVGVKMGRMQSISYPAADGTPIPAYLTLPPGSTGNNLPAIVMPHGGPSSRDEWGFDWMVQYFAVRGFAVLQPNYRGSAGFGSEWYKQNGFQSWKTAIGDVDDAGRWLRSQGIAAPGKLAIVGWSYGGYAALQGNVLDPDLFKAVIAIAPVTDLARFKLDLGSKLTRDFIGSGPHISEGSPAQNTEKIKAPVLLFHGDRDVNVNISQSRLMRDRLHDAGKSVTLVEFPDLDHQLASTAARTRVLADSDSFLRTALGL